MSSEDVSIVHMNNVEKHATTVHQDDQQCINGIKAETTLPLNDHKSPTGTMSLVSSLKRGCALVAPGGPYSFTFAPRGLGLENLHFFIGIIWWAPWILHVQSTGLLSVFSQSTALPKADL